MASAPTQLLTAEEFYKWTNKPRNRDKLHELSAERSWKSQGTASDTALFVPMLRDFLGIM